MKMMTDKSFSLEDMKQALKEVRGKRDSNHFYLLFGIIITFLAVAVAGVVYWSMKKKSEEEDYYDDWDCDWEDEEKHSDEDCCCTDKDVDKSVKIESMK